MHSEYGQAGSPTEWSVAPRMEDLAAGALTLVHHALLLVGSRLPEDGIDALVFATFARVHCGIELGTPQSGEEPAFWERAASHPDVVITDREATALKLDDVEPMRARSLYAPTQGRRRLFLVDRCERLLPASANALLKVLEEPAAPCLFVFTARSLRGVLPTIASRCQRIVVRFTDEVTPTALARLEPEDAHALGAFFRDPIGAVGGSGSGTVGRNTSPSPGHLPSVTHGIDFAPAAGTPRPSARALRWIVERADAWGKKYDAHTLIDACLESALAAHAERRLPLAVVRLVKEDARAWRDGIALHPNASLQLGRILLRMVG